MGESNEVLVDVDDLSRLIAGGPGASHAASKIVATIVASGRNPPVPVPRVRVVPGALTLAQALMHQHPDWTVEDAVHAVKAAFGEDPVTELVVEPPAPAGPFVLSAGDVVRVLSWARFVNEQGGPMPTADDAGSLALALALEAHLHPDVFVVADGNEPT